MSVEQQLEILGKVKRLKPLPPEAVTAASSFTPSAPTPKVKPGTWISKQKTLDAIEDAGPLSIRPPPQTRVPAAAEVPRHPPPAAALSSPSASTPVAKEERKSRPNEVSEVIQVASDVAIDGEDPLDGEDPCGFCMSNPGKTPECRDCGLVFCFECQNDHPEECLGDFTGPRKSWQCFGCLNKADKKKAKRRLRDSTDVLLDRCDSMAKEIDTEVTKMTHVDIPSAPPSGPTSTVKLDYYCSILPEMPEEILVHKEPLRTNCQLPLCSWCVKHKNPTVFTVGTAVGVAVPCGHAVACKECAVDFCSAKKNLKCPVPGCKSDLHSVVIIQNSITPPAEVSSRQQHKTLS
jgi:hypothetical protein